MQVFDDILEILKDREWHSFQELWEKTKTLNQNQLEFILSFMQSYDFIQRERKHWSLHTKRVKLNPMMANFLDQLNDYGKIITTIENIEKEETSQ